ncbi:Vacuolar protein sorting-associated protein, partial [Globisporangium splendens]
MFLQRYVHVLLDAVLGSYVKNIDPDALKISVWNGKIEVEAVELQPEAFPLPKEFRLVKGTLHQLRIDMPWTNLANQPIRVDIADMSLLLQVCDGEEKGDAESDMEADPAADAAELAKKKQIKLRRKRATMDAIERATQFNERNVQLIQGQSWTQSFFFKLLVKVLDNVQLHVQHLHLRLEDSVSDPKQPYAVGMTLESLIVKSADAGWNYTMVVRGNNDAKAGNVSATILRKKMDINKFGIYWSLPLAPVPQSALDDGFAFAKLMQMSFWSPDAPSMVSKTNFPPLVQPEDYIIHPLTVSMKLTINDGDAKLPLTHQELSDRVLSRLGTPWMIETIDAIGDEPWREFLAAMPKLAGDRKYTLGFVFSEAWSVARDMSEEEDVIPSVEQFKIALSSCLQWSAQEVDRLELCIVKYRDAVVHVMEEKSTYIDANASIDQIRISITRKQYLSALSMVSFLTVKRRQARYLRIRPQRVRVKENPALWWKYAIRAVLIDVRERLAHVDWEELKKEKERRRRYMELYTVLVHSGTHAASLVSSAVRKMTKDEALRALDDLEFEIDTKQLLRLRRAARKDVEQKDLEKKQQSKSEQRRNPIENAKLSQAAAAPPPSSSLWSYASWLRGSSSSAQSESDLLNEGDKTDVGQDDVRWSDQDTKDLYDAIDFHPEQGAAKDGPKKKESEKASEKEVHAQDQQHIWYRFQLRLTKGSFGLYQDGGASELGSKQKSHSSSPDLSLLATDIDLTPPRPASTCLLLASLDDVDIQFLFRPSSIEMGFQVRDAFFCQDPGQARGGNIFPIMSSPTQRDFFLQRMDMDEIFRYHPVGAREKISSVRLRECEKELPLLYLSLESRREQSEQEQEHEENASIVPTDPPSISRLLRVSLVTQPIKCNVNLMYLLGVSAFFARPLNVDLSGLEHSAWKRAQSLQRYSTAQLREALARRTRVEMQLDVISPLINVVQVHSERVVTIVAERQVSLLVFLGHLRASTIHPARDTHSSRMSQLEGGGEDESSSPRQLRLSPVGQNLYDIIEFSISGIEVQIFDGDRSGDDAQFWSIGNQYGANSAWNYLLEKTSLSFSFHMSVAPDDPTLPLLKLFGGVDSVQLNLSASSFRSLLSLLRSFGENFSTYTKRKTAIVGAREGVLDIDSRVRSPTITTAGSDPTSDLHSFAMAREIPVRLVKSSSYFTSAPLQQQSDMYGMKGRESVSDSNLYTSFTKALDQERERARRKEIEDKDLLKLWKRVICQLQFGVGEVVLKLQLQGPESSSEKLVVVRAVDISTRLKLRTYDRRLEFALGTFAVEDILRAPSSSSQNDVVERKRYLMTSGGYEASSSFKHGERVLQPPQSKEQLIRVGITSISSDAEMPKDKLLWKHITYDPLVVSSSDNSVWQDPLLTQLSVDASLRTLTIDLYQDTLSELFVFFFKRDEPLASEKSEVGVFEADHGAHQETGQDAIPKPFDPDDPFPGSSPADKDPNEDTLTRKFGAWVATSFLESLPGSSPDRLLPKPIEPPEETVNDKALDGSPAIMQLRLHVDGLSLFLHLEDKQRGEGAPSAFMSLTTEKFCCCVHKYPLYLGIFSYLTSLKINDVSLTEKQFREIISHAPINKEAPSEFSSLPPVNGSGKPGHIPTLEETLKILDTVPAVFSCAAQFYGANQIQESWHPGYANRFSVRLKSPRIRFLYSFVDDLRRYFFDGQLLKTIFEVLFRERVDMLWEGDFQLAQLSGSLASSHGESPARESRFLGSDVVSMFPLLDVQLDDAVLEMPPHRMSSEALVVRFDKYRMTNEHVLESVREMENRIVAKVLLNSSLTQLKLNLTTLRVVSVILVDDREDERKAGGGYVTQSLLGSTDISVNVDFRMRAAVKVDVSMSPIHLVCNQKQYAFVLRVPFQNIRESSRYYSAAPRSGKKTPGGRGASGGSSHNKRSGSVVGGSDAHQSVIYEEESCYTETDEDDERHILLKVIIPEISMELLQGQDGYHPSKSGDICMAEKDKTNQGSICVLDISSYFGKADYCLTTGKLVIDTDIDGIHVRDSRLQSKISAPYRDVVVFERGSNVKSKSVSIHFVRATELVEVNSIHMDSSFLSSSKSSHASPRQRKDRPESAISPSDAYRRARTRSPVRTLSSRSLFKFASPAKSVRNHKDSSYSNYSLKSHASPHRSQRSGDDMMSESYGQGSNASATSGLIGRETRMDLIVDIIGFRVIPSNIYCNVLRFLESSQHWSHPRQTEFGSDGFDNPAVVSSDENTSEGPLEATEPLYRKIGLQLNLGPSALLLVEDPTKDKSRALMLSWEANISFELFQEVSDRETEVEKNSHRHNQLQLRTNVNNIHATSRIPDDSIWAASNIFNAAAADCLKPIGLELVLHIDLETRFLRFRTKFDRVMELRFGYLDFCTAVAALENILRNPWSVGEHTEAMPKKRTSSGSSSSLLSVGNGESEADLSERSASLSSLRGASLRSQSSTLLTTKPMADHKGSPALYGKTLVHLVSTSVRGRLQSRPVVGLYNSPWRKRYLVLPYTSQERNMVQAVAFRILPAPGSRRDIGDQVYYGDRIVLEAIVAGTNVGSGREKRASEASPARGTNVGSSSSTLQICKYDQLGANGYLGPDGSAGKFETTIWKHGSSMFNSDRSVIYDKETVVLEEITIYRAFSKGKHSATRKPMNGAKSSKSEADQGAGGSGSEGGGYLMFNGVGDAPVPFALSIVSSDSWGFTPEEEVDIADVHDENAAAVASEPAKPSASSQQASILQNLKILEFTLPGVNATIINDFHNMLLPLLHFRVAMLHADVRGRFEDKFTALTTLRFGVQAYNSQLAVWEPAIEDFDVNMAYHGRGGVLCDYCMSERQEVSPSGTALRCDGIPKCLFRSSRTDVFAEAAAHSWEAKHFIYRELLVQSDDQTAKQSNTFLLVIKKDFNVNISRNVINVMLHFMALISKAATTDEAVLARLGPFIYVDNQSGIPFLVATHSSSSVIAPPPSGSDNNPFVSCESSSFDVPTPVPPSSAQTNEDVVRTETTAFEDRAWSRRRLSTMLNDISSSSTRWLKVNSGERIATDIVAHETPAGSVTSPLRRLLWLKPQSASQTSSSGKAIPVPIGYSNRSYLYLESNNGSFDVWHGESVICETVAEQGTLVLRLRGKVQLTNFLDVPIQVMYNEERTEIIAPGGQAAHYIPIQFLENGTISFCPMLSNGKLQKSQPLSIGSLLKSEPVKPKKRSHQHQIGSLELRRALTFYWDEHPEDKSPTMENVDFAVIPLPPFQLILTATRKSERHETMISLRSPIQLENLIPYEISFRTACLKLDDDIAWVEENPASFPGTHGKIASGSSALIGELELLSDDFAHESVDQVPSVVALSLAIPEISLAAYSSWSAKRLVYGCKTFCERIELSMASESLLSDEGGLATNKLTICVEVVQLEKLRTKSLNVLSPVVCRVFTEYWLIDRTTLSLSFYTADGYRIPSNHSLSMAGKSNLKETEKVSLSVFSSESKQHVSKMKVGVKGSAEEVEVRSDPFDISAVGVRGQILVPTRRGRESKNLLSTILELPTGGSKVSSFKQYEFGVTIEQGPGKFSRSKVVTLVSRYHFVNSSHRFDIHIRQERNPSEEAILVLKPKESKIFHWSDSRLSFRVQIRFVQPGTPPTSSNLSALSQWSSPFELSSVGNFVLRLKKNVRPAPHYLKNCYEAGASSEMKEEMDKFLDGDEYWNYDHVEAQQMIAGGMQLHVAVELHDPSFFVYLEEGAFDSLGYFGQSPALMEENRLQNKEKEGFVQYKIKNECSSYELVVWQKMILKDDSGNALIGFEGGEQVLPFHTVDYVPYTFSAVPKVFIQVQKVAGLKGKSKKESAREKNASNNGQSLAKKGEVNYEAVVVANFEAQLNKLHRLPPLDVEDGKVKKRLYIEVQLDQTTKTLVVTDMLPGVSGEHKRRRRSSLLRSWKRYSSSILSISQTLASRVPALAPEPPKNLATTKKKQVRFAKENQDEEQKNDESIQAASDDHESASVDSMTVVEAMVEHNEPASFVICVKLVDVLYLEELFKKRGRTEFASCQPFLSFDLKCDGSAGARSKLVPQPAAVFPRWVPSAKSESTLTLILKDDDVAGVVPNASVTVQVRESDKLLFGSSLFATAEVPLHEYLSAIKSTTENMFPDMLEFSVPIDVPAEVGGQSFEEGRHAMIKFQMCCQFIPPSTDAARTIEDMKLALKDYSMKKELDCLVSSKSRLKILLEGESVDVTTGRGNLPAARDKPAGVAPLNDRQVSSVSSSTLTEKSIEEHARRQSSLRGSSMSVTTDDTISDIGSDDLHEEKRLTAVLVGVSNLQIPPSLLRESLSSGSSKGEAEPKVYCTITYRESTRSAASSIAKSSQLPGGDDEVARNNRLEQMRTHEFSKGQSLGLDLVYRNGRVLVQGIACDGSCGALMYEGKIRIGDTIVAVNGKPIVNLHREASFGVIEKALQSNGVNEGLDAKNTFSLSFMYQAMAKRPRSTRNPGRKKSASNDPSESPGKGYDAEWNRRVEFTDALKDERKSTTGDERVLVRVYLRNGTADHGLSSAQEPSVVPFLYFFGDDTMMDHLDHSKQDSRFDVLLAECWVPLPPSTSTSFLAGSDPSMGPAELPFYERICALYSPQAPSEQEPNIEMVGQLRLALKWDFINPNIANQASDELKFYCQIEVARVCLSIVDDGSNSSVISAAPQQPREVLCISLSDQNASAGIQLSYGVTSGDKHVVNARVGHFQIDNQLLDTNYPVMLSPIRLVDYQQLHRGNDVVKDKDGSPVDTGPTLLPTFQLMSVFSRKPNLVQFEYIFGQLQELEIKLEDSVLVALAQAFSGIKWPTRGDSERQEKPENSFTSGSTPNLALHLLGKEWSSRMAVLSTNTATSAGGSGANMKVLLRWLLLCPVKVNVTFTSTADRSLLLSLLSPDLYSILSTLISAAAALVSNLDKAPIKIPEFYVENLLETTHTLAFYAMQHYLHHGLRSWYNIMGSVDFLGNPIGLVSTLGTGVKDFFYTPAQMLLEDEKGLRIENLRTGMTKGSKSLLRNTAVGIFHTTGKITETLGKGIAMLAMDEQYNVQRQRQSSKQIKKINDLGDAITEGGKGLAGGVWDGIKGVVAAPVRGAERDGASGFVFGIGKGFAGLIVKPTAGFLDLLTSLSRGAKTSAESIDGANHDFDTVTRFRLPRRLCGQKIWEVALDSSLQVEAAGKVVKVSQSSSAYRTYSIECDDEVTATNFRIAVDSARVDLSATRYLLLNLEKNQEEAKNGTSGRGVTSFVSSEEERTNLHVLMENVQDTMVTGLKEQDLRAQPLRSIQVYGGPYQWTVYRRFSEFRDLQAELEDAGHAMESLPPLPPRTFLPSTRDAVVRSAVGLLKCQTSRALIVFMEWMMLNITVLAGQVPPRSSEYLFAGRDHALVDQSECVDARVFDERGPRSSDQSTATFTHRQPRGVSPRRGLFLNHTNDASNQEERRKIFGKKHDGATVSAAAFTFPQPVSQRSEAPSSFPGVAIARDDIAGKSRDNGGPSWGSANLNEPILKQRAASSTHANGFRPLTQPIFLSIAFRFPNRRWNWSHVSARVVAAHRPSLFARCSARLKQRKTPPQTQVTRTPEPARSHADPTVPPSNIVGDFNWREVLWLDTLCSTVISAPRTELTLTYDTRTQLERACALGSRARDSWRPVSMSLWKKWNVLAAASSCSADAVVSSQLAQLGHQKESLLS